MTSLGRKVEITKHSQYDQYEVVWTIWTVWSNVKNMNCIKQYEAIWSNVNNMNCMKQYEQYEAMWKNMNSMKKYEQYELYEAIWKEWNSLNSHRFNYQRHSVRGFRRDGKYSIFGRVSWHITARMWEGPPIASRHVAEGKCQKWL